MEATFRIFRTAKALLGPFVLILATLIGPVAGAGCEAELTPNQKLQKISPGARGYNVAITHLLKESFDPWLNQLSEMIRGTSKETIQKYASQIPNEMEFSKGLRKIDPEADGVGYDGLYDGEVRVPIGNQVGPVEIEFPYAPYNQFNRAAMIRLNKAILIASRILSTKGELFQPYAVANGLDVIDSHTFAEKDLELLLYNAHLSILQSAAQMASDPVDAMDADQILRASFTANGQRPSLMVMYSLMLPPAVLGPNGSSFYVKDPLVMGERGLTMSAKFREFLRVQKEEFAQRESPPFPYELGHGCPVAHCMPGQQQPSLQAYLEAILYVYKHID